ncbi:hypothetical protein RND71_042459 [Anisodus tanguticus]|uniref:Uncharacterized protein n=1 Tax=Anisodus tanguticus TaxID=243964 RepID=A0AAE1UP56_9SOLA|nr:hypothetical protein RND71_042459 [Anisodus tanguticus]
MSMVVIPDLFMMENLVSFTPINLPAMMMEHIVKIESSKDEKHGLGYDFLLTRVLQHFGIKARKKTMGTATGTATTRYDHTLVKETQPAEGLVTLNQIYVDIPTSITASRRWSDEVKEDGDENDVDSIDQASKVTKEPEAERLDVILKLAAQSSEFIKSMYEARLVQRIREVATSTEHVDDGGPSLVMIKEEMERKQKRMKADEPFPYLITEKTLIEESRPLRYYTQYARMSVVALAGQFDTMIEALLPV